jgi:hypothetical protein
MRSHARHVVAALVLCALAAAALYPFCGLVFRCGCTAIWMTAASHCNVHHATGPHCPWCEHPGLGTVGLFLTLVIQALLYVTVLQRSRSAATAGFASVLSFPPAALLAALLTWLPTDYPHFLGQDARRTLGLPDGPLRCVRPEPPPPRAEAEALAGSGP